MKKLNLVAVAGMLAVAALTSSTPALAGCTSGPRGNPFCDLYPWAIPQKPTLVPNG